MISLKPQTRSLLLRLLNLTEPIVKSNKNLQCRRNGTDDNASAVLSSACWCTDRPFNSIGYFICLAVSCICNVAGSDFIYPIRIS